MAHSYGPADRLIGKRVDLGNGRSALVPGSIALDASGTSVMGAGSSAASATQRKGNASTSAVQLLPANANRINDTITNDTTATPYVLGGADAGGEVGTTRYTYAIAPTTSAPGSDEVDTWKGEVRRISDAANGAARITERS